MSDEHLLKLRTREHIIADLGVNHAERHILLAGYTVEHVVKDYGIDLRVVTFNEAGEVENGKISIQVKATDHLNVSAEGDTAGVRISTAHFKHWLLEWEPVLLILYDAVTERAFWLDVQEYARLNELDEDVGGRTITLRVPLHQTVSREAAEGWRDRLRAVLARPRYPSADTPPG